MPRLGSGSIKPAGALIGKREESTAMKKIGIVGGLAWPSTADYYRLICSGANAHFRALGHPMPLPTPPIVIESVNIAETRKLRGNPDGTGWERFDTVFRETFRRLQTAGCDFGIIASNTPHARLDAIRQGLDLPILGIIEETARQTARIGATRALVLGTAVTMRGDQYPQHLREQGIEPNPRLPEAQIEAMQRLIDNEFYEGATEAGTRQLLEVCRQHVPAPANTAILLACTELPLAFPAHAYDASFEAAGFRFINTSVVHARAALAEALRA
jgi:aspartate racemase